MVEIWVLEKIERINLVKENRNKKKGAEFTSSFPVNKTVNELFINTKNKMGNKFLPYQSANNNCQIFIIGVLDGNELNNSERTSFVKQDTKSIFKNNPALRKFANTLTDIGGYANAIMQSTDLLKNSTKKKSLSDIGLADKDNKQTISDVILKSSEPAFVSPEVKVEKVSESTEVMVENKAE